MRGYTGMVSLSRRRTERFNEYQRIIIRNATTYPALPIITYRGIVIFSTSGPVIAHTIKAQVALHKTKQKIYEN